MSLEKLKKKYPSYSEEELKEGYEIKKKFKKAKILFYIFATPAFISFFYMVSPSVDDPQYGFISVILFGIPTLIFLGIMQYHHDKMKKYAFKMLKNKATGFINKFTNKQ